MWFCFDCYCCRLRSIWPLTVQKKKKQAGSLHCCCHFHTCFISRQLLNTGSANVKQQDDPPRFQIPISPRELTEILPAVVRKTIKCPTRRVKKRLSDGNPSFMIFFYCFYVSSRCNVCHGEGELPGWTSFNDIYSNKSHDQSKSIYIPM